MAPAELVTGATYYQVTYADPQLTMVGVNPVVFLGEVTTDDDGVTHLAFQDALNYLLYGSALQQPLRDEVGAQLVLPHELPDRIYNQSEMAAAVAAASERAVALGHPALPKGGWRGAS